MFRWTPYTFVRTAIVFTGGIILGVYQPGIISLPATVWLLLILAAVFLISVFTPVKFDKGVLALTAIFLAGYLHLQMQTQSGDTDHILALGKSIEYYQATLTRYSEEKQKSWKAEAQVENVLVDGEWQKRKGKLVLYFSKEGFTKPFKYGDQLLIKGSPQKVSPPANPGEFDYRKYLSYRNIFHQHFLRNGDVIFLRNDPPWTILEFAFDARKWSEETLSKFVEGEREQAVASALVLGVTDNLDNELLNAYAATGAMHVLAVSGLHISIIYMILLWLMKPVLKLKSGEWILAITSLVLLWIYAFITGLSPSVLRAVTMFTFIALARPTQQSTNIFNTLGASVFCLLLFDPYLIMSVGFQLSYLAVIGIVYLQSAFYNLWEPKSYLADETWKISCVSVVAQIATFPLGLLYFHQFPNYFLISNLLVIPASFVVLIAGIVLLAVSFINVLGSIVGFVLTWSIKILNGIVFVVEQFPFSLLEDIDITTFQCWMLMMAIIMIILMFQFRKFMYAPVAAIFLLMFTIGQWDHHLSTFQNKKLTVYNVQGHTAIDIFDHGQSLFFTDTTLLHQSDRIRFHIHQNRLTAGIGRIVEGHQTQSIRKVRGGEIISSLGKTIFLLNEKDYILPEGAKLDFIIIGNEALSRKDIKMLKTSATIILDSSNSYFYSSGIVSNAKEQGIEIYSVKHHGAFEQNFTGNI